MPEQARQEASGGTRNAHSGQIRVVTGRTVMLLKSFGLERVLGDEGLALAGRQLPTKVGMTSTGLGRVLCTAPDEWLLVSLAQSPEQLRNSLEADCLARGLAFFDLSSGLSVLEISGPGARAMLVKGCGLDLDRCVFASGRCARTRFAQIAVVIDFVQEPDCFELYVARSYAHYLDEWLADSGGHFSESRPAGRQG